MGQFTISTALAFQIAGVMTCSVLGSLFLGIWLNRHLGVTPWVIIIMMVIGLTLGMVGAYHLVKRLNEAE
jgi:F0F1-type ATP synthase assembly protein I